jgi:antibiotic biosynthesis monooxygenase (ABM) superfamily enzyme
MSEVSPVQEGSTGGSVTTVVRAHIKPGKEPEYEEWLHGINEECSQFAGFQGATVFRPDDESHPHPEYVIVVRFANYSDLRRWEGSLQLAEWHHRLEPLLRDDISVDSVSGMETWFTLPGHSVMVPPPKYKMAVVATIGATLRAGFHTVPDRSAGWGSAANRRCADNPVRYVNRHDVGNHAFAVVARP